MTGPAGTYTIQNAGTAPTDGTSFEINAWENETRAPSPDKAGTASQVVAPVLAISGTFASTITIPTALTGGTGYLTIDRNNQIDEMLEHDANNVSTGCVWAFP